MENNCLNIHLLDIILLGLVYMCVCVCVCLCVCVHVCVCVHGVCKGSRTLSVIQTGCAEVVVPRQEHIIIDVSYRSPD